MNNEECIIEINKYLKKEKSNRILGLILRFVRQVCS